MKRLFRLAVLFVLSATLANAQSVVVKRNVVLRAKPSSLWKPRTRPLHKWKKSDLDKVVNKNIPVRISGWLLYDFEHTGVIGSQRASVWEVHPITKIEVKQDGSWTDLTPGLRSLVAHQDQKSGHDEGDVCHHA